jgi:putative oxidoreductase
VAWGDWAHFLAYAAKLNWFLPHVFIAQVGTLATGLETLFAIGLPLGIWPRFFAFAIAGLLLFFALSMTFALGIKAPLNYSVYTAAAAAAVLGTIHTDKRPST